MHAKVSGESSTKVSETSHGASTKSLLSVVFYQPRCQGSQLAVKVSDKSFIMQGIRKLGSLIHGKVGGGGGEPVGIIRGLC